MVWLYVLAVVAVPILFVLIRPLVTSDLRFNNDYLAFFYAVVIVVAVVLAVMHYDDIDVAQWWI